MIEFDRVSRRYGDLDAIRNLNLTLARGEMAFLTGHQVRARAHCCVCSCCSTDRQEARYASMANEPHLSRPGLSPATAVALGWCFKSIVCCLTGVSTITWPCHW